MGSPRIDQVNVVVPDVAAAAAFLRGLGIEVPASGDVWDAHHVNVPTAGGDHAGAAGPSFGIDLDSSAFAREWGGLPSTFTGVVVDVRVDERDEVDRLHHLALTLGARSLAPPHDAFWGSRFALVDGPGPLQVGLMSRRDPALGSAPPDPAAFA